MIFYYFLAFVCGLFTKLTDNLLDEPFKSKHPLLPYASGIAYGLLAGFLATRSTELATLVIAITIGVLIAGKIDSREHQLAVAALFLFAAFYGLPQVNFLLLAGFIALGFLDEILNDLLDRLREKGRQVNRAIGKAINARLSLEIGTLAVGIVSGNFVYFLTLLSFDIAYNIVNKLMPLFLEKFAAGYGPQLALDLYKCNAKKLGSKEFLLKLLNELPGKIGMRKISQPQVFEYSAPKQVDSGLSGFVLIAESHITIHTYPLQGFGKIDVVSCKRFDLKKTAEILQKAFNARETEMHVLNRGKHYPRELKKAKRIVQKERKARA